jgi:lipoprotein-anchoring transpeptidase ErfK/SrfK
MQKINLCALLLFLFASCDEVKTMKKKADEVLNYKEIVKTIKSDSTQKVDLSDSSNILDKNEFDPSQDSLRDYLDTLNKIYENDSAMVKSMGVNDSGILAQVIAMNENINDTFTSNIKKIKTDEIKALKFNLDQIRQSDSLSKTATNPKHQIERRVWARVNKTDQRLYLYIDGVCVDTFKVSTGDKKHETPTLDRQPAGPIFQKYTSKKYPGGNYNGLGNMPYVVFVQGGYGIHGTTRGNIPKLGKKASHGCVRVHPDNAKILNELVRKVGLINTWVTIEK